MTMNKVEKIDDRVRVNHVLISVSDKRGLETFVPRLLAINPGIRIFSTGGTFARIREILGEKADSCLTQVCRLHRPAGDPGRTGENPGFQNLPGASHRDLQ